MSSKSDFKTNVMRILDKHKISYKHYTYADTNAISGVEVAAVLKQDPDMVFKTLVCCGKSKKYYVFMVPVARELDLKKAAAAVNEKSVEMIHLKDLLPVTGYIHGGCSPIGMKKLFATVVDESALNFKTIIFSAGKIGYQVELSIDDLQKLVPLSLKPLTV